MNMIIKKITLSLCLIGLIVPVHAGTPLWTFKPLTATTLSIGRHQTATVSYEITNQSRKMHLLVMKTIPGVTQITTTGNCASSFTLAYQQSCILNLSINGDALPGNIMNGPVVCEQGNLGQCYQPSAMDSLHISYTPSAGPYT
ncbi:MAG: hypothetical protein ACOVQX_03355 [Legionella sp.]